MTTEMSNKIGEALEEWSNGRLEFARVELEKNKIGRTSMLAQSLRDNGIMVTPGGFKLEIVANDYYYYVDQGVKGLKNEKFNTGKCAFKTKFVSRAMVESIRDWIPRNGIIKRKKDVLTKTPSEAVVKVKKESIIKTQSSTVSKQEGVIKSKKATVTKKVVATKPKKEKAAKTPSEEADAAAFAIAYSIKQKGLKGTLFWSNTFNEKSYQALTALIENKLGGEFRATIKI